MYGTVKKFLWKCYQHDPNYKNYIYRLEHNTYDVKVIDVTSVTQRWLRRQREYKTRRKSNSYIHTHTHTHVRSSKQADRTLPFLFELRGVFVLVAMVTRAPPTTLVIGSGPAATLSDIALPRGGSSKTLLLLLPLTVSTVPARFDVFTEMDGEIF